jgi:O-antigen ligase
VFGVLVAILIVGEQWHLALGLVVLIPSIALITRYPFAGVIMWTLLNAFVQETHTRAVRMAYWAVHRALPPSVLGLIVLAALARIRRQRRPTRLGPAEAAAAVYLGLAVLNVLWFHSSPLPHLYSLYDQAFVPVCLYLLVRLFFSGEKDVRRLLPVALVLLWVETAVGAASWLAPQVIPSAWLDYEGRRGTGTLAYPHAYSTSLVFFSFLLFHAAVNQKRGLVRAALLLTSGLGAFGIFLSFTRGSWLGALAASTGLLFTYPKATLRIAVVLVIVMGVLGGGVLSELIGFAGERLDSVDTARERFVIWDAGLQMIRARPFLGWGYGNYRLHAGQFERRVLNFAPEGQDASASHNSYIGLAAEMGLPTLLAFAFPVLWWLNQSRKAWRRMPKEGFISRPMLILLWMVILDHIVVNFFSDMRHSTYGMGMWWITLGLIGSIVDTYIQPDDSDLPRWLQRTSRTEGLWT